ncbi:class I SAM-dependent methyltransferase [Phormidium sp. CLA17]|uniref:class I SAM-dependent methyltransferase n=1 Tax=Leptolyngbya sp. Cla-17 TaxID=2803751 RepID=UPI0014923D61|nr:class I SAM-dependent methyltransferase [Leptolyngbya sp. Cla-17]MBM0740829.1 class I SAM-dependent methyltransferase [Leptolyngbya sp. Cla-17]
MENKIADLLANVSQYYSAKLAKHGETPRGVDWNGEESQTLRFQQLSKVIRPLEGFSLNDLGCGYGALCEYLGRSYQSFTYNGYDVSDKMIGAAQVRYTNSSNVHFTVAAEPQKIADYGIASGIFNVRLEYGNNEWRDYVEATLDVLDRTSRHGFAFNCLTSYSDADKMQNHLYYADPCVLFDLCKRRYSRNVALFHDYGLYEFTILVKKHS